MCIMVGCMGVIVVVVVVVMVICVCFLVVARHRIKDVVDDLFLSFFFFAFSREE